MSSEISTLKIDGWLVFFVERRIRHDLDLRFEAQNLTSKSTERIREIYAGSRASDRLLAVEVRDLNFGPVLFFRLRKSL